MPKSAKKRREKAADFSKAKLKLGKGKQTSTNAIDTSFKARSITLPSQSISSDKDKGTPTTRRRHTLEDLISHTKHYSSSTRKDAILGLKELLSEHWDLVNPNLTAIVNASVRLISDDDTLVRKTLVSFYEWFLPRISVADMLPHTSTILLYTTSAQTHIFPEIRVDAVRFIDVILSCFPDAATSGWSRSGPGNRIIQGYLGLLSAGSKFGGIEGPMAATSTASVVLTPISKLAILKSMAGFLDAILSFATPKHNEQHIPTWYIATSFPTASSYERFEHIFQRCVPSSTFVKNAHSYQRHCYDLDASSCDLQDIVIGDLSNIQEVSENMQRIRFVLDLSQALHSTLVSTFLDNAATVFSPPNAPPKMELQTITAVAQIAQSLYGYILRNLDLSPSISQEAQADLKILFIHMRRNFPYIPVGKREVEVEETFETLNTIFCELASLLQISPIGRDKKIRGSNDVVPHTLRSVNAYITRILDSGDGQSFVPIRSRNYISLLPTFWVMSKDQEHGAEMLSALILHSIRTSSKSVLKNSTIEFVSRLVMAMDQSSSLISSDSVRPLAQDWILHLPKVLWELGSNNLGLTETISIFLLRFIQRKSKVIFTSSHVASLASRMSPYFSIIHATRGLMLGPFSKLPHQDLRHLALDVAVTTLYTLDSSRDDFSNVRDTLREAVERSVKSEDKQYWEAVSKR